MTNTRELKDLGVSVKAIVEAGISSQELVLTLEQKELLKDGLISMCLLTDEMPDKPADYNYEFLKGFVRTAPDCHLLQFVDEIRKGMSQMDIIEDFVSKFEDPEVDAIERTKRVVARLKSELGKEVDIQYIKEMAEEAYKAYKRGEIDRRTFGNFAMFEVFENLSNSSFVNILFFNKLD